MILEDHQKHQPAEGGKVSERWVGKLSKRCVQMNRILSEVLAKTSSEKPFESPREQFGKNPLNETATCCRGSMGIA